MQPLPYSPKQADVLINAGARWNLLVGATSSGKTWVSYDLLLKRALRQPPGDCMLIGKTLRTLQRNVLNPMRERFGESMVSRINGDGVVHLFGRPFYAVGANDEKAIQKIQGSGLVYAYGDEFVTWPAAFFSMLKSRMRKPGACFDGTANPEGPKHWAKETLIDKAEELGIRYWHFILEDNTHNDPAFVEDLKRQYAGTVWYGRYILGEWVAAEGVIYDMWDAKRHVIDDSAFPKDNLGRVAFRRYWVWCDYGDQNPTRFLLIAEGADDRFYVLAEYHHSGRESGRGRTLALYAADLTKFMDEYMPHGAMPQQIGVDPSAAAFITQLHNDRTRDPRFSRVGQVDNTVLDGIRATGSLLGQGRIKVHKRCKHLIGEFSAYVWDPKAAEKGEDAPIKANDHSLDPLRYHINGTRQIWLRWTQKGRVA